MRILPFNRTSHIQTLLASLAIAYGIAAQAQVIIGPPPTFPTDPYPLPPFSPTPGFPPSPSGTITISTCVVTVQEIECPDRTTSNVRASVSTASGVQTIPVIKDGDSWLIEASQANPPLTLTTYAADFSAFWNDPVDGTYKKITLPEAGNWRFTPGVSGTSGNALGSALQVGSIDSSSSILVVKVQVEELLDSDCDHRPDIEDPLTDAQLIQNIILEIDSLNTVQKGIKNSLIVKLIAAVSALNAGNTASACASLQDFINHTAAQKGKKLSTGLADALMAEAQTRRQALQCP